MLASALIRKLPHKRFLIFLAYILILSNIICIIADCSFILQSRDCEDIEPKEEYCPTAPAKSESDSAWTSKDKENKEDCKWAVAIGRQEDFFSIPTKMPIPS